MVSCLTVVNGYVLVVTGIVDNTLRGSSLQLSDFGLLLILCSVHC